MKNLPADLFSIFCRHALYAFVIMEFSAAPGNGENYRLCKHKMLLKKCPCCKTGTLITIEVFGKRGPPGKYFMEKQMVPVS